MPPTKTHRPRRTYTDKFKNQLIQLYLNGKRKFDISREYDFSSSLLDKWIKQSTSTCSIKEKDNTSKEEQRLIQLRKKVKQLEMGHLACEAYILHCQGIENDTLYPQGAR